MVEIVTEVEKQDFSSLPEVEVYNVACQKKWGEDVHVYKLRASSRTELFVFAKRILQIQSLTEPAFLEIHEHRKNGQVGVLYGDTNRRWPKNVKTVQHEAIIGPKPKTEVIDARIDVAKLPPIVGPTPLQEINERLRARGIHSDSLVKAIERQTSPASQAPPLDAVGLSVTELVDKDVAWIKPLIIKVA